MSDDWKSGLFGCLGEDQMLTPTCCASFLFPQAQLLYNMRTLSGHQLGPEDFLLTCCCFPCMQFIKRREIQTKYEFKNKDKNLPMDILVACCCQQCGVQQQSIELAPSCPTTHRRNDLNKIIEIENILKLSDEITKIANKNIKVYTDINSNRKSNGNINSNGSSGNCIKTRGKDFKKVNKYGKNILKGFKRIDKFNYYHSKVSKCKLYYKISNLIQKNKKLKMQKI
ncbi:hypothetical protein DICPUDRAFT_98560 [Dictyostelium purpureum]|uniref:Uncharacterized protein n=1 Tax=Dictyostelium purpureum TaxID=5786 RepID=F0ZRK2_DICPU|nr:uncharacterized protein DICPUDRAFT_98560 [Dictyostelium purpureum]EGC33434.1 hypothetical protein DICPUDRAFT_98560 [Dictyostelium purpureum]|eukprot:XP_003290053.1 hypothetical protein DICPUDRAFT_98560 [Dictyostelium purpureum]